MGLLTADLPVKRCGGRLMGVLKPQMHRTQKLSDRRKRTCLERLLKKFGSLIKITNIGFRFFQKHTPHSFTVRLIWTHKAAYPVDDSDHQGNIGNLLYYISFFSLHILSVDSLRRSSSTIALFSAAFYLFSLLPGHTPPPLLPPSPAIKLTFFLLI